MKFRVEADPDLVYMGWSNDYHPRRDVADWLKANMGKRGVFSSRWGWKGRWSVSHRSTHSLFSFNKQSDAVMFKLTWGGKQ